MPTKQDPKAKQPEIDPENATQEANQYDKVFKETLRESLPLLMTEILRIPVGDFKPVHLELQRTIERKADFIGKLVTPDLPKTIAHLEVQAKDEHNMVLRAYVYSGLIIQQYPDWDLLQCVFYIGKKRPKMPNFLKKSGIDYHFRLIWIKDIHYREFLKTNKPEIMLLGLLAGYGDKSAQEVLTEVVHKIRQKTPSELDFQQRVQQLHILSNLHQIQHIFENVMLNISELIDERKDPFFQRGERIGIEKGIEKGIKKGREEGRQEGREEGREEGLSQKTLEVVLNLLLQSDHEDAFIAAIAGVREDRVAVVRAMLQGHPLDFREQLKDFDLFA